MPIRKTEPGTELHVLKEWDQGFTWMAHPEADLQRASQAIEVDGKIWLVDPLDTAGLDDKLRTLGEVAGVVVLGSHHERHADRLARRHGVAIHVPEWFSWGGRDFDARVEDIRDELDATGFELLFLRDNAFRQEGALYHPDRRTLVVSDTLMTALFSSKQGRPELFPPARIRPTYDALRDLDVERMLLSHGEPVFEDVEAKIERALDREYRSTLAAFVDIAPFMARFAVAVLRD